MFLQDLKLNNHNPSIKNIYLGDQYMIGDKKVEFKNYQISSFTDKNFILDFTTLINEDGRKYLPKVSFNHITIMEFDSDVTKWLKFMSLSFNIVRKSDLKHFHVSINYEDKELRDFFTGGNFNDHKEVTISNEEIEIQDKNWLQNQFIKTICFDAYLLYVGNNEWMFDKLELLSFRFDDNTPRPVLTQFKQWIGFKGWIKFTSPCIVASNS